MITVYSAPNCVQCKMTKDLLNREGLEFEERDAHEYVDQLREWGFGPQLPIVVTEAYSWQGFKPDHVRELAREMAA